MKKLKIIGIIALVAAVAFLMAGCPLEIDCPDCNGSRKCTECNGAGYSENYGGYYDDNDNFITEKVQCYRCNGSGKCQTCHGTGKVNLSDIGK